MVMTEETALQRILFVDDELNILQGLKRMLKSQRNVWEMDFAESGEEALEKMKKVQFDIVVSDMRMPGMNGVQLLNKVKKLYPRMARFILSGHTDKEMLIKSVGQTHQFLAKPCDPEVQIFQRRRNELSRKIIFSKLGFVWTAMNFLWTLFCLQFPFNGRTTALCVSHSF